MVSRISKAAEDAIVSEVNRLLRGKKPILVALDGRSGTGKSTLAGAVAKRTGAVTILGDDFYSGGNDDVWRGVTAQAKATKAIDWRRMRDEALEPLLAGKPAIWHPMDFEVGVGFVGWKDEVIRREAAPVIILDGAYSARPELSDLIDLAVLVEADDDVRRTRLRSREGESFMEKWHGLWDEAEDYYFTHTRPRSSFDLVVKN